MIADAIDFVAMTDYQKLGMNSVIEVTSRNNTSIPYIETN